MRPVNVESAGALCLGMVVAELDGKLIVGHNGFEKSGPQNRVDQVQITPDGLRWIFDGGMFGPLNVDLVSNSDTLRVEVTGADGKAFLAGTGSASPRQAMSEWITNS